MDEEGHSRGRRFNPTTLLQQFLSSTNNSSTPMNRFSFILSRASTTSRRIMREPSSLLQHNNSSTLQSEDNHNDWAYSKPVIVVDVLWNLAFVLVSLILLLSTLKERPSTPLRFWIAGYALQCLLHVGFVYLEHRTTNLHDAAAVGQNEEHLLYDTSEIRGSSIAKRLESMNTMVSFFWWVMGFYWIVVGGQALLQDAPRLYWLAVVFLAFDVFFAIFCVVLACVIAIALCCCLPCIIVMLYAVVVREGASEGDISVLPRYRFRPRVSDMDWKQEASVMEMESGGDSISEISLSLEDSECCICLTKYIDGVELHRLPCSHHFHCGCIAKWLRINAKCPLCKYNLLSDNDELV
ncbi:E3 ubiquitin-protein ligase family [Thalictrum thalictroides]|uniref:RING-type E3 ubiquitin transferase n=1 Tax=Thalictrum thalictroides TaxID=46969 RepID=A0A7J6VMW1_THATH|nr:E3 ubiquitin-protein ligase family [Thalictrum thalictroides]